MVCLFRNSRNSACALGSSFPYRSRMDQTRKSERFRAVAAAALYNSLLLTLVREPAEADQNWKGRFFLSTHSPSITSLLQLSPKLCEFVLSIKIRVYCQVCLDPVPSNPHLPRDLIRLESFFFNRQIPNFFNQSSKF